MIPCGWGRITSILPCWWWENVSTRCGPHYQFCSSSILTLWYIWSGTGHLHQQQCSATSTMCLMPSNFVATAWFIATRICNAEPVSKVTLTRVIFCQIAWQIFYWQLRFETLWLKMAVCGHLTCKCSSLPAKSSNNEWKFISTCLLAGSLSAPERWRHWHLFYQYF